MSERSEHLIERAAAKLRAANTASLPDGSVQMDRQTQPRTDARPQGDLSGSGQSGGLPDGGFSVAPPRKIVARPTEAFEDSLPDHVAGPIPTPSPPLTRPVLQPVQPPVTISNGPLAQQAAPLPLPQAAPRPLPQAAPPPLPEDQPEPQLLATGRVGRQPQLQSPVQPAIRPQSYAARGPALTSLGFEMPAGLTQTSGASASSTLALQPPPIVQLDALERAGMVVARTTRTRISEEYRIAIGRILRVLHETADIQGARNVLMVTSARPGEGKSFTALNLAGSIAQNGTDAVLLVDVDPKVKPLSDQLGLGDVQGFLDLVSDPSLRPEDLLRVTAIPNLAVLPVGTRLGGAAQTVGGTASMRPIIPTITRLARRFPKHLIMLDAPPCLSTSDPHTLAPHVGQVVLVVEAERTQRSEVEAAVDLVRVCPSITLLLNKVRMTTSHTFGAYDYFGSYT
jgi:receptor protein-tyrosine kinase